MLLRHWFARDHLVYHLANFDEALTIGINTASPRIGNTALVVIDDQDVGPAWHATLEHLFGSKVVHAQDQIEAPENELADPSALVCRQINLCFVLELEPLARRPLAFSTLVVAGALYLNEFEIAQLSRAPVGGSNRPALFLCPELSPTPTFLLHTFFYSPSELR